MYEKDCQTSTEEKCTAVTETITEQECSTTSEQVWRCRCRSRCSGVVQVCNTINEQECRVLEDTVQEEQCTTVQEEQCRTVQEQQCKQVNMRIENNFFRGGTIQDMFRCFKGSAYSERDVAYKRTITMMLDVSL